MEFAAPLWEHDGPGAWCFVTVPEDVSEDLRFGPGRPKGFGSIRVEVTVGSSVWRTSVFPDNASAGYVLPIKKSVRRAEDIEIGDTVKVRLDVVTDE
jgi:hypothetical protein